MATPAETRKDTLKELRATRKAMMSAGWLIALEGKPVEVRRDAAHKLQDVALAILRLENAKLREVRDQLIDNEVDLRRGRESLARARVNLSRVQTVLNAVGKLLGVVAKVAKFAATGIP